MEAKFVTNVTKNIHLLGGNFGVKKLHDVTELRLKSMLPKLQKHSVPLF
jgi:hypothetical protein